MSEESRSEHSRSPNPPATGRLGERRTDRQRRRRPPQRRSLPEPPEPRHETFFERLRRKLRRKTLRFVDRVINRLYRVISRIEKVAPSEKRYYRVAIFGSSRIERDDEIYPRVRDLARRLSYIGCDIVTGGGPGLMTAANEGAREGAYRYKTRSFGLTILLPIEEQPNPFLDEVAEHKTFFSRLHQFIRLAHAYIVVDGGIGTTLEALMVWQMIQVRLLDTRPLIFVGPMWKGLRDWVERDIVARRLASPGDTALPYWVDSMDEAVEIVREARNRFLARHEVLLPPPMEDVEPEGGDAPTAGPTAPARLETLDSLDSADGSQAGQPAPSVREAREPGTQTDDTKREKRPHGETRDEETREKVGAAS